MKLKSVNVYTKTKVLFKFSSLESLHVEMRSKKNSNCHLTDTCGDQMYTLYVCMYICTRLNTCEGTKIYRYIMKLKSVNVI